MRNQIIFSKPQIAIYTPNKSNYHYKHCHTKEFTSIMPYQKFLIAG